MADKREFEIEGKALSTLRVVDLKLELDKRGLSKSGSKKELADRLKVQLQLEKLHESASTDEGHVPNLKLQDEMVEQNDLIKDYLSQQQQIYAQQKENRRLVELEEQRTRDSEASAGDTSQEEEEIEQPTDSEQADDDKVKPEAVPMPPTDDVQQPSGGDGDDAREQPTEDAAPSDGREKRSSGTDSAATTANVEESGGGDDKAEKREEKEEVTEKQQPEVTSRRTLRRPASGVVAEVTSDEVKLRPDDEKSATGDSDVKSDATRVPNSDGDSPDPAPPDKEPANELVAQRLHSGSGKTDDESQDGPTAGASSHQKNEKQPIAQADSKTTGSKEVESVETSVASSPIRGRPRKTDGDGLADQEPIAADLVTPVESDKNKTHVGSSPGSTPQSETTKSVERSPKRRRLRRLGSRPSDEASTKQTLPAAVVEKTESDVRGEEEEAESAPASAKIVPKSPAAEGERIEGAAAKKPVVHEDEDGHTAVTTKEVTPDVGDDEGRKTGAETPREEDRTAHGREEEPPEDVVVGAKDQADRAVKQGKRPAAVMGTKTEDLNDTSVAKAKDESPEEPAKSASRASPVAHSPVRSRRRSRQSSRSSSSSSSSASSSSRSRGRGGTRGSRSNSSSGSASDASRSPSRSVSPVSKTSKLSENNKRAAVKENDESARSSPPRSKVGEDNDRGRTKVVTSRDNDNDEDESSVPAEEDAKKHRRSQSDEIGKVQEVTAPVKEEPAKVSSRKISISSLKDKQIKKEASVEADDAEQDRKPLQRKRRWGGGGGGVSSVVAAGGKKISLSITTDSLKDLIPDVKPPSATIMDTSMDAHSEDEPLEQLESPTEVVSDSAVADKGHSEPNTPTEEVPVAAVVLPKREAVASNKREPVVPKHEPVTAAQTKREPVIFRTVTQVVKDKVQTDASEKTAPVGHQRIFGNRVMTLTSSNDNAANSARRSPSPARFPKSQYLHIKNLVRPFTLNQLKELLSKTGTLVEGQFWIDKIKSKCYVMYELEEQAVETRQSLHGIGWPSSNPKRLIVDFSNKEELDFHCQQADVVDIKRTVDPRGNVVVKEELRSGGRVPIVGSNRLRPGADDDQPERKRRDSRRGSDKDGRSAVATTGEAAVPRKEPLRPSHEANRGVAERSGVHKRVGVKERVAAAADGAGRKPPVREWDKDKIGEKSPGERARGRNRNRLSISRSRSRSRGRKSSPLMLNPAYADAALGGLRRGERDRTRQAGAREHRPDKRAERHREDEAPAKLLDDLFHKTKTTPCIYWLPLTVEQIKAREEQKKQTREEQRKREQADLEKQRQQQTTSGKSKERNGGGGGGSGTSAGNQAARKPRDTDGNRNRRRSASPAKSRGRKR